MSTSSNAPYHHGNLRQALLEAAMVILDQHGEEGLGLRDLARAVGVSAAAPYRHFDSRVALLEALAVTGYGRFTQIMETIARSDEPEPRQAMGRAYVHFALDNPNLFRLMFSPQLRRDGRPGLRMAADAAYQTLRHVIDGDTDSGRFAAIAAWSRVHGLAMLLLDAQIQLKPGEDIEALVAQVLATP